MSELDVGRLLLALVRCRGRCHLGAFQRWMQPSRTERGEVAGGIKQALLSGLVELSKDGQYLFPVGVQVATATDKSLVLDWWGRLQSTQYSDFCELGVYPLQEGFEGHVE